MGVWQWIREYFDALTRTTPIGEDLWPGNNADVIAHIIQRAAEGGHWMLTPPHLLTLVHAVQQPIGHPEFIQLDAQHHPVGARQQAAIRGHERADQRDRARYADRLAFAEGARCLHHGRAQDPRREHRQDRPHRRVGRSGRRRHQPAEPASSADPCRRDSAARSRRRLSDGRNRQECFSRRRLL